MAARIAREKIMKEDWFILASEFWIRENTDWNETYL